MQAAQKQAAASTAQNPSATDVASNQAELAAANAATYSTHGPSGLPAVVPRPGAGFPARPVPAHPPVMPRPGAGMPAAAIPADPTKQPSALHQYSQNPQQRPLGPNGHPIVLPRPGAGWFFSRPLSSLSLSLSLIINEYPQQNNHF